MSIKALLPLFLVVGLVVAGCQTDPGTIQSDQIKGFNPYALGQFALPADATLESATLFVYVNEANNETINIHRINEPWDETTVTWNNFGGAFDPVVVNSFVADGVGWHTADVTTLMQDWLESTHECYGLLLDQMRLSYPRASYFAREFGAREPYMEICYVLAGVTICENTLTIADAYIYEGLPDINKGANDLLYTGWLDADDPEKQSLISFDVEPQVVLSGCTHTKGYWDNWDGLGERPDIVTRHLPMWVGNDGGTYSILVTDVYMSSDILGMELDNPKNGLIRMMAQLLCAKLNISTGADESEIIDVVNAADNFVADHNYMEWYNLGSTEQTMILDWMEALSKWNAGEFGPGRCIDYYIKK